ncbi:MAG TPA: TonB-dependent receptor [Povalibacter sp.]|nr:TonB-dependent receptor [Povalibacter sp.]
MGIWGTTANKRSPNLRLAVSAALLGLTGAAQVLAQDAAAPKKTDQLEEIVVTGIRESMTQALDIKRESMQLVDAIVAEDIGKFPDNNAVEALQRVPGVQVTDRARGEVGRVAIRGLEDVTTTINGRNIFTASGRQIALADVPASLLNRVDVYKTRSADLIEQGIAGVIDIVTQRPFNFPDSKVVVAARGIYQEQNDNIDPNVSALISDRWNTGIGEIGALLNVGYAKTRYRDQSVTAGAMVPFVTATPPAGWRPYERIFPTRGGVAENPIWQAGTLEGLPTAPGSTLQINGQPVPYLLGRDAVFASDLTGTRERPAANLSLQWAPNDTSEYVFETFYNGYRNDTFNHLMFSFVDWWGNPGDPNPTNVVIYPGTNIVKSRDTPFPYNFMSGDLTTGKTDSYQYSLGGKWEVTDALHLRADVTYQDSRYDETFFAMRTDRVAPSISVDFNSGGGLTSFSFGDNPATTNIDESDLSDLRLWNVAQLYDNALWREGDATTLQFDGDYDTGWGFVNKLSFGVRLDDRTASEGSRTQTSDQRPRTDGSGNSNGVLGVNLSTHPELAAVNSGFFDGRTDVPSSFAVADGYYIRSHADQIRNLYNTTLGIHLNVGDELVIPKNFEVDEMTSAGYLQGNFETDLGGHTFDGQLGARYVSVDTDMDFFTGPTNARIHTSASQTKSKLLPSLMMRFAFTDDLRLRASYGETLRRPNFVDLNPNITYVRDVTNIGYGTASGGNPNLKPTESKNYDVSLEWYFAQSSAVYVTLFERDIQGLVVPFAKRVTYTDATGPYDYILSQPDNASDGKLKGVELGVQYFPDNVPDWLKGFGVQASYTSLDSSQDTPETDSAGNVVNILHSDMFGISDSSYSAVLVYEKEKFDARLSYVWRDDFLNNYEARLFANPLQVWRGAEQNLDFQVSYNVSDAVVLTFDATNLTDEIYQSYYVNPDTNNFGSVITGRTFALGARVTF